MWFVGYTPQITTSVWVGNAEYDVPMQGSRVNGRYQQFVINGVGQNYWYGGTIAAPIWKAYMVPATAGMDPARLPRHQSADAHRREDARSRRSQPGREATRRTQSTSPGSAYALSGELIYDPSVPAGTIVKQSPEAGSMVLPGGTVTYYMSTDAYPGVVVQLAIRLGPERSAFGLVGWRR